MPYDSVISRTDAGPLIPEEAQKTLTAAERTARTILGIREGDDLN